MSDKTRPLTAEEVKAMFAAKDAASHPKGPKPARYWTGDVPWHDDFGQRITNEFIDGGTKAGPWAFMTPKSFRLHGRRLGTGFGQRYKKQADGRWLKVEG